MRAFKLLGIGAAVVVLIASLWPDVALAQDQITIYRVLPVQVTRDSVLKLAREAFGMDSPTVTEDEVAFMLQQEQKRLTVWKASGAILFADASKLWNHDYRPHLPPLTEARILAEEFIRKNALVPRGGQLTRQGAWVRYVKQGEQEIENHWELAYTLFHITTGFSKDGIPETEDLGALTVELGDNGEVIGLQRELGQELGPQELKPYLDYEQTQRWLRWKAFQRCQEDCPLLFLTLAWSNFVLQGAYNLGYTLIVPGSLGWGEGKEGEALWYHIPQTSFAVLARIVAPQHRAQFSPGAPIGFRAEVAQGFGTPPYRFLWYSNRDGLLSQASTFSKALSPGRHVITLWVSDRNGTVDTHTVIIHVGTSAPWPGAVGLVSSLALILGQWRKRWALMALLGGWLLVTTGASGISLQQPQPLTEGYYAFWPDASPQGGNKPVVGSKLTFRLELSGDNGLEVENLRWTPSGRDSILWLGRFLVPYIEITPQGQAPIKLEIPKPPKFSRLSVIQNPNCDPKKVPAQLQKGMWGLQDLGRALEAHYDLEVKDRWGKKLGTVNLVFDFRFYHPSWCRNSRVPEFYPEIRYTVQGFAVAKVRVPFLFKADIIDSQNDVAMMVKDPLIDVIQQGETNIACNVGARTVRPEPRPNRYTGGEVVCLPHEFMEVNFDGYYQGDVMVNVPACSMQTCFIFRVLKPALGQKFIAVLANPNEDEPQKLKPPKEPEDLIKPIAEPFNINNKKSDIEFWYIAESDKPQDTFAADLPMWPVHFIGLSCASSQPGAGQSLFEPQACE